MPPRRLIPALIATLVIGCSRPTKTPSTAPGNTPSTAPGRPFPAAPKVAAKIDAPKVIGQARRALQAGNLSAAELLVGDVLAAEPLNRAGLLLAATVAQRQAQEATRPNNSPLFLKSAEAVRTLVTTYTTLTDEEKTVAGTTLYNAACTLSLDGEGARAVETLIEAFKAGFGRIDLLDTDDELDPLRKLPEFQGLQKTVERAHVLTQLAHNKDMTFPFDFALPDVDGKTVRLADFKGKVTLLQFWGTWCVPSRKQVPHLIALEKQFGDEGFAVVSIAYESGEGNAAKRAVRTFDEQHEVEYPSLIGDDATLARIPDFAGFPTTLFLDREGKVRYRVTGYLPLAVLETVVTTLLDELKARPAPVSK